MPTTGQAWVYFLKYDLKEQTSLQTPNINLLRLKMAKHSPKTSAFVYYF